MPVLGWWSIGLMLVTGVFFVPSVVAAQTGFYASPSFSFTELYDDNLFLSFSQREKDFISRFSPGIETGYQSAPLTLLGRYSFDAERFADHPGLNKTIASQNASIEFRYLPIQLLTLSVNGVYLETQTPGILNVETGLETGRMRAQRFSLSPSVGYRFDSLTGGTAGYTFTKDELSGGLRTLTHTANLGLDRRITQRDTGSLGYTFNQFSFNGGDTTVAHTFTVGWTREATPQTRFTLRAGPRFSEGAVDADVSASIHRRLKRGELSLTYTRSQTTVIGQVGTANTDSIAATFTYQPFRSLQVTAAPGFFRSTLNSSVAKVYRVSLEATYHMTRWLSLTGSYQYDHQQGLLGSATGPSVGGPDELDHNVFFLRFVAAYPSRPSGKNPGENP